MRYDQEQFNAIAAKLAAWGFKVWRAERGTHGFYSDDTGARVVSFQTTGGQIRISGNYAATRGSGTGWHIADNAPWDKSMAQDWLTMGAPAWANRAPVYVTVAEHMAIYGKSSGFAPC